MVTLIKFIVFILTCFDLFQLKERLTDKKNNQTVVITKVGSHDKRVFENRKRKMLSLSFYVTF